jgi:hypothetical protein
MAAKTKWNLEMEYVQSCNCDYGCPCSFNGRPSHGSCEAFNGYRVTKGSFGNTKLAGVKFAQGLWWPKAIHEGDGAGRLYIDPSATAAQRKALEAIWSGQHGGAVWEIFPKTWSRVHPPKSAKITWKFSGHDSAFAVEGIGEVRSSHIKNPVTGEPFEGQIVLPGGIQWRKADVTSVDWTLRDREAGWDMRHANVGGFVAIMKFNEKGVVG